ncbi:16S rRNA (cytosine(1402)-N(4))-methyltransferase [Candidatus Daviesbacteria bacterium RIFCSPHIGHO2_12_FULL_37_11]|uniref:Ribosomal RNA small subunit methyltransferase H n=1 Tax=Candidatus Daviesbacteria bacterium RIFCSPHIGHO2_12_FULL_37_11 TaxID=1797777 RepID=A0A1F5KBH6_9BACT|nr:MAG: 16S rRNA (cytosine(1402)-N(4))-methyltransferase [Candidatus Daviesbacteria bacterium RIFCSPHIGHO2_01_FULL_37_27]OGE38286.1 MAG: 16S rRNA (cytosine(1402)-N(4))-methyltransferase [Candidatus Daviesbacteria bacterium RIFCSPHIGHO2_12_FULL_37_11]OGE46242.1 MAG: 16S rRNA (cytosine(1402)-N(4))-methyltransferase [Candidatus Daviesbacteria bacterium RIFCSPLOWO2_01_FULL_37_10]
MEGYHEPVLLKEVLDALNVKRDYWYLDATLGDGGHSLKILKLGGNILGLDVDSKALERAKKRFERCSIDISRYKLKLGNFRDLERLIKDNGFEDVKFAGILFDLGVSSLQFESAQRGFSIRNEGSLDMRMDPTLSVSALDLINGLNKGELYELFNKLGEEKFSKAISDTLVSSREVGIKTTKELAELVEDVYRKHGIRKWKIHPATKVFQALRIAVNDELNSIREALPQALEVLDEGGKVIVISFHSLEDRIVKNTFKDWEDQGFGKIITKKPVTPSEDETTMNPRSRSSKMRVFRKNRMSTSL